MTQPLATITGTLTRQGSAENCFHSLATTMQVLIYVAKYDLLE